MEIRRALLQDAEVLSALCTDVQHLHARMLPDFFKPPPSTDFALLFMQEQLSDANNWFFIARHQGEDIGYVFARLHERSESPFMYGVKYLFIDQISVKAGHRRIGCGRKLIERVFELAEQADIKTILLETWSFNQKAQAFFASMGFEVTNLRMWRKG